MGLHPKQRAAGLIWILDGIFISLPSQMKSVSVMGGDISVHPPEVRKLPFSVSSGVQADPHWCWKLEQSVITQLQPCFMHRDCYPVALTLGCFSFFFLSFCYFFRWNLRRELQNTKQLWLWLPLWVPFPPPVVTGSWGKAKAVRSLQKKREINAGRVCTRQLICCEVWVPCSC